MSATFTLHDSKCSCSISFAAVVANSDNFTYLGNLNHRLDPSSRFVKFRSRYYYCCCASVQCLGFFYEYYTYFYPDDALPNGNFVTKYMDYFEPSELIQFMEKYMQNFIRIDNHDGDNEEDYLVAHLRKRSEARQRKLVSLSMLKIKTDVLKIIKEFYFLKLNCLRQ